MHSPELAVLLVFTPLLGGWSIPRTLRTWVIIGAILFVVNGVGYRRVLPGLFDRERLVTGSKS